MKKLTVILLGLCAAIPMASAQTQPSTDSTFGFYARPELVVAFPGHFDTSAGGGLALGLSIAKAHAVEAEAIYFVSTDQGVRVKFLPMVGSYLYSFSVNNQLRFKVGGSVGATQEKSNYWGHSWSRTAFTYGPRGGVSYRFADNMSLDADISVLHLNETGIVTSGNIVLTSVGVSFRF